MTRRWLPVAAAVAAAVLLVVAPLPVVLGATRLVGLLVMALGAWLLVGRAGFVDLATGAAAGVGAYLGAVVAGLAGLAPVVGLAAGTVAGAAVGGVSGAVGGRVGRTLAALPSLALGTAVVALLRAWPAGGGVAGFHAVPLLTAGDRSTLLVALLLLAVAAGATVAVARTRVAVGARLAATAADVATSLGRRPAGDAAVVGAVAGGLLGLGGALHAFLIGSVAPAGFGLGLAAALALAVLVGGAAPAGPVAGALLLWAPAVVWPLVPGIGDAPVLASTGIVALLLLALRRGRPLVSHPTRPVPLPAPAPPRVPRPAGLATDQALPGGRVRLEVAPGEVVAVVGPNGSGKSTLLARVAGQVPEDRGATTIGDVAPRRGAVARARAGVARTFQRSPELDPDDALPAALDGTTASGAAAAWAVEVLGPELAGRPAGAQLVRLAARRPAVALLDEPAAELPPDRVAVLLRGLADGGAAVLVVEHRPEAVADADRVVRIGEPDAGGRP